MTDTKQVEELAAIIKPAMPNHCCGPDDMDDCPYDAHDAHGVAEAVTSAGWEKVTGPYAEIFERQRKEIFELATQRDKAQSTAAYHQVMAEGFEAKVRRVEALADRLEHWYGDDSIDDVIAALRAELAGASKQDEQTRIADGDDEPPALEAS